MEIEGAVRHLAGKRAMSKISRGKAWNAGKAPAI